MRFGSYNPLDKTNLARSIEQELLRSPPSLLSDTDDIQGAGMYVLYYSGPFEPYQPIRCDPELGRFEVPIYVGKAIPKGGRKGGLSADSTLGTALRDRLRQHAASISEVTNLDPDDFWIRWLVVDDIWIPLGENMLIESFRPLWNRIIDGFGNKDPGRRRATQYRSPWDELHPGRAFADKLARSGVTEDFLQERVADYFAKRPIKPLPARLEDQLESDVASSREAADMA